MASEHHQPDTTLPMPSNRARRIPDEEWDTYREKLVKLYVEEEVSQKDIIDIMANEHNFIITEKQLKHRLRKWNVRKHISSSDMGVILSLKRKQDASAKDTKIQYQGYALQNDRLERASKRRKDRITTPPLIPPHITLCRSQLRSPPLTQFATFAGYSNVSNVSVVPDSTRETSYLDRAIDTASSTINFLPDLPLSLDIPDAQASSPLPQMTMPQSFALAMNPETTDSTSIWTNLDNMLLDGGADSQGSAIGAAEEGGILGSGEESATISEYLRFLSSLEVPPSPPKQSALSSTPKDPLTLFRGHTLATSTTSNDSLPYTANDSRFTLVASPGINNSLQRVFFHGTDPEGIIPQLQLVRSQLSRCLDGRYRECHLMGPRSSQIQLSRELTSDWLLAEVDDILCWAYDVSADLIRQRRAKAGGGRSSNQELLLKNRSGNGRISKSDVGNVWMGGPAPQLRGIPTSSLRTACETRGIFQVQLLEMSRKVAKNHDQSTYFVTISFIPEISDRTIGISVAFERVPGANQHPRLCPTITTFNVVPEDSEIITTIKQNDIKGLQRLLDEKKASALDVDPSGFSLLYYAMFSGCSEVYRLLLQGGASTQHCNMAGNINSLLDCIWYYFMESNSGLKFLGFSERYISDINQCSSMANLALTHGCEVRGYYFGDQNIWTPLFELSWKSWTEIDSSLFPTLLANLLAAGYELEGRNVLGQTPLLYAAHTSENRQVTILKQFLSVGANIHATDNEGRGALHQALDFRRGLTECNLKIVMKGRSPRVLQTTLGWRFKETVVRQSGIRRHYFCATWGSGFIDDGDSDDGIFDDGDSDDGDSDDGGQDDGGQDDGGQDDGDFDDDDFDDDNFDDGDFDVDFSMGEESGIYDSYQAGDDDLYVYVGDLDFDDFDIDNGIGDWEAGLPRSRQKTRMRLKLLILLEAGCNPNVLDNELASPSDYAREEDVWPQWEWALTHCGYMFDEDEQEWIRDVSFSDIVDMTTATD